MISKDLLILFLVASEPGIKDIFSLIRLFDTADFPGRPNESLKRLYAEGLIKGATWFKLGKNEPSSYVATEKGMTQLNKQFDEDLITNYISDMDNPDFLLSLTLEYIKKWKS